ncbi:MAG: NmrA family NAD(P)-binding protein [Dehalococcoidia bacterium]
MYVIAGVSGHVGSAAARELLAKGEQVKVLVRDPAKGEAWSRQGAEVAVVDLNNRAGLAEALRGSSGFFALLPSSYTTTDFHGDQRLMADAIAGAVKDSGVPHVVMLSSLGAELAEGTGPLLGLHELENRLRETGVVLSAIRCTHFQEKVEDLLGAAQGAGIYPVFGESADVPIAMVATRDIGAVVAETLLSPPSAGQVIDLEGPAYTERQVAEKLSAALGKPLQVVTIPQPGWVDAMVEAGLSRHIAEVLVGLYDAGERGILQPKGDRRLQGRTEIDETLRSLVQTGA